MVLSDIIYENEYTSDYDISKIEFLKISTSYIDADENSLLVLLESAKRHNEEIKSILKSRSPAAIICDSDDYSKAEGSPIIKVENARKALAFIYSRYYEINYSKFKMVAVTGTNGKTSTATMIMRILEENGEKVGFIGTGKILINGSPFTNSRYSMTTPDPDLLYRAIANMGEMGCTAIVMEVSSHALFFEKVAPIRFNVAVFTNLSHEHLDFHKDMESYYTTKLKLFSQAEIGIFNIDDTYSKRAYEESEKEKRGVGIINKADATGINVTLNGLDGSEYVYRESRGLFKVKLQLGGAYNVYNSMMALSAAIAIGVPPCVAKRAVQKIESIDGRLERFKDSVTVIIDYAHTEAAMSNVLKLINSSKKAGQKSITVFGCGGERDKEKRPLMARAAERLSDSVIVTSDNSRSENETDIINDILLGFEKTESRRVITSRKEAIEHAILEAENGDIIAILGKGHEKYNIGKNGYTDFDETEIVRDALRKRNSLKGNEQCE